MTQTTLHVTNRLRGSDPTLSPAVAHFLAHLVVEHHMTETELRASPYSPFVAGNLPEWREAHRLIHKLFPHKVSHEA